MKKRIVCFGDSNTWGYDAISKSRYLESIRWPKLLANMLGDDFEIIEEGLPGRTSTINDPLFEGLNALDYIYPCLMSHAPLHMVIIMLGTNDTKERFNLTSYNIAQAISRLSLRAKSIPAGFKNDFVNVLVVAPPPIGADYINSEIGVSMGKNCDIKSFEMSRHLRVLLKLQNTNFLDTKGLVEMNDVDFMHLSKKGHSDLASLIFSKLKDLNSLWSKIKTYKIIKSIIINC